MNRNHTREEYLKTVKYLVNTRPNIKFSSDFIIGYPGETEKDFQYTLSLIEEINFINSFSFIYNSRPGTPASKLENVIERVQKKRLIILQDLLKNIQLKENKSQIGKLKEVLIENKVKNEEKYFGRTENLTPVIIDQVNEKDIGKIISVKIKNCNRNTLFGENEKKEREAAA